MGKNNATGGSIDIILKWMWHIFVVHVFTLNVIHLNRIVAIICSQWVLHLEQKNFKECFKKEPLEKQRHFHYLWYTSKFCTYASLFISDIVIKITSGGILVLAFWADSLCHLFPYTLYISQHNQMDQIFNIFQKFCHIRQSLRHTALKQLP